MDLPFVPLVAVAGDHTAKSSRGRCENEKFLPLPHLKNQTHLKNTESERDVC